MKLNDIKERYAFDSAALNKLLLLSGVALTEALVKNSESTNKRILSELKKKGQLTAKEEEVMRYVKSQLVSTGAIGRRSFIKFTKTRSDF